MKLTFLGTGTSTGIPQIGCTCPVCTSTDVRDKRLRCSGLLEIEGMRILIDCGPDFRQQMLTLDDFRPIDAVLITHEHYDHVGGLDDLRPYCIYKDIPLYTDEKTARHIRQRIPYCFTEKLYPGVPRFLMNEVTPLHPFSIQGEEGKDISVLPLSVLHGRMPIVGYRIGNFAWITDMKTMPAESWEALQGVEVLVINALQQKEHPAHQTLEEALASVQLIGARQTYLIHLSHYMGRHEEVSPYLPKGIDIAYDQLTVQF